MTSKSRIIVVLALTACLICSQRSVLSLAARAGIVVLNHFKEPVNKGAYAEPIDVSPGCQLLVDVAVYRGASFKYAIEGTSVAGATDLWFGELATVDVVAKDGQNSRDSRIVTVRHGRIRIAYDLVDGGNEGGASLVVTPLTC